ncbi:ExeM/NucH family extracellular endonuclease [Oceanobacter mangrovi]|uniref:ExeM/NucH family extracellular endonuclease n=1 Tax=Oceanobacter mangrovi TaxID=2862510 RepID=UPI001C8DFF2F|nr:ExeM/NucH family extracellular endonuclease [Oceanobacter mangrovi]
MSRARTTSAIWTQLATVAALLASSNLASAAGSCGEQANLISSVQGSASSVDFQSPLLGSSVTLEGIVTQTSLASSGSATGASGYGGFWLQEEDADTDNKDLTSEAVWVADSSAAVAAGVSAGDQLRLQGTVAELDGVTSITNLQQLTVCATNQTLPKAFKLVLPVASLVVFEALEGMRVQSLQGLVISDLYGAGYGLGNYGQLVVSSELHFQPTDVAAPGSDEALALAERYQRDRLLVDDGSAARYPAFIPFPDSVNGFSADNPVRIGDSFGSLSGVLHQIDGDYVLIPGKYLINSQARDLEPAVSDEANLRIASMNLLNYFNGDGEGSGFPTSRGANSVAAFDMQSAKIVAAMDALDADIIGLMELENDGFGYSSAIQQLLDELNQLQASDAEYAFINPQTSSGLIGTDQITVGLFYRPARLTLQGQTVLLTSANSPTDSDGALFLDSRNRPSLIQTFEFNGFSFTVAVNHLKSRGSSCGEDNEGEDGQGNCNLTRSRAAQGLLQYLQQQPTGISTDATLIIGDLNAYSQEDPLQTLVSGGFSNLLQSDLALDESSWSYSYSGLLGSLDHALATGELMAKVVSVADWHINSVEDSLLGYETEANGQAYASVDNYANPDAYRSSDHDPVIIGLLIEADDSSEDPGLDDEGSDSDSSDSDSSGSDGSDQDTADTDNNADQDDGVAVTDSGSGSGGGSVFWFAGWLAAAAVGSRQRRLQGVIQARCS